MCAAQHTGVWTHWGAWTSDVGAFRKVMNTGKGSLPQLVNPVDPWLVVVIPSGQEVQWCLPAEEE